MLKFFLLFTLALVSLSAGVGAIIEKEWSIAIVAIALGLASAFNA